MRVERSDLVLRVGVSCLKTACGDKLILPLFGGIDATRATVSVTLVRCNTMYHQEEMCPRLFALCEFPSRNMSLCILMAYWNGWKEGSVS